MNEQAMLRVQQLAEQADNFTIENFGTSLNLQDTKKWLQDTKEWQCIRDVKFAELIVKECIDALEHESDRLDVSNDYESGYQQGVNHAARLLTNHFNK